MFSDLILFDETGPSDKSRHSFGGLSLPGKYPKKYFYLTLFRNIFWRLLNCKTGTKAVVRSCSVKKLFLEILQNSQENTCARAPATLWKKRLWHNCFPVNFAKFLRTSFFTKHLWWLLFQEEANVFSCDKNYKISFF